MKYHVSISNKLQKTVLLIICLLFIFISILNNNSIGETQKQKIYIIPVSGEIDPSMAAFIKRTARDLPTDKGNIFIFEMDTFGGRVDSALQIVETIVNIPNVTTIAYVKTKAISAGALISLACRKLVMKHNTTIGDCAPITYSSEGPQMLSEKFQSPLRAKFRALAKQNGYPVTLAEAMVTAEMEVYRLKIKGKTMYVDSIEYKDLSRKIKKKITSKKTIVAKGELLTMDNREARELGFSRFSVSDINEMLIKMKIKDYEIVEIGKNWSESFVSFLLMITPILMIIGMGALYTELKSPGFGVPGIVGIICLALAFGSQYMVGLADYTDLLVIVAGIILLGLEVFVIPGFGAAGIAGLLCIVAGMILALQDFTIPDPSLPWEMDLMVNNAVIVLGSFLLSFFVALFVLRFIIAKVAPARGPYLKTSLKKSHADSKQTQKANIGDEGIAISYLRPSGKMDINNEIYDVIAEGEFIEKDTPIVITQIKGNQIIVTKKES